jgi:CRP-like cAMP-binding protein/GNAT superfamily N-acetyltransferase
MIDVRPARPAEVAGIRDIFEACYGHDYPYAQFYDLDELTRLVYSDHQLLLVAEDTDCHRLVGTASVVLEIGAMSDLIGEFGRLAVLPDARQAGIGRLLMNARLEYARDRLHVALVEARLAIPYSLRIAESSGFAPVGVLPMKMQLQDRESFCLLAQHFGDSLSLRRNHPHVIPEVYPLAQLALSYCGLSCDAIVDEEALAYPEGAAFAFREMTTQGYATLLRIERGRVRHREIYGPRRLHDGLFRLQSERSHYLLAMDGDRIVGAVGWNQNPFDRMVRVFELIALDDSVPRWLLSGLERICREGGRTTLIEIDVSAHSPRMQRTLLELGFLPAGYVPAMVFSDVERLDIVRMVRLFVAPEFEAASLTPRAKVIADTVLRPFVSQRVLPEIERAVSELPLFCGLEAEQVRRLAGTCRLAHFAAGDAIFDEGHEEPTLFIVLSGEAGVYRLGSRRRVGVVRSGECLGEMSLLTGQPHSASVVAASEMHAATLSHEELQGLVRTRPDIGLVIFRNLAVGLGAKLGRASSD